METGGIREEQRECLNPERTLILLLMAINGPVQKKIKIKMTAMKHWSGGPGVGLG